MDGPLFAAVGDRTFSDASSPAAMEAEVEGSRRAPQRPACPYGATGVGVTLCRRYGARAHSICCSPAAGCARRCDLARRSSPRSPTSTPATSPPTSRAARKFGYLLLWVVLVANLMAMLIQYLSAKLGIVTGRNLPELCREHFPRPVSSGHLGAGRDDGDVDRHRRVHRRRARAEPALRRPAPAGGPDHRRRSRSRSSSCSGAGSAASSWRSPACSGSSCSASSTRRCGSARSASGRAHGLVPGFEARSSSLPRGRDHRRDRDAARDLPALGADPGAHARPQRRGARGACCASSAST